MEEQPIKLKANPFFALLYLIFAQSFSILIVLPSFYAVYAFFVLLIYGGDLQNVIFFVLFIYLFSLVLFTAIVPTSFIWGWPAFLVGYMVSLWLLRKQEGRLWVWVSVLGAIGFAWSLVLAWIYASPSDYWDNIKLFMGLCFLTASGCGFFMWLFVRYALKKPETNIKVEHKQPQEIEMGVL